MSEYTFNFKVKISNGQIDGSYTVVEDNYVTAESQLREYLRYGLGDVEMEIELAEADLRRVLSKEVA